MSNNGIFSPAALQIYHKNPPNLRGPPSAKSAYLDEVYL